MQTALLKATKRYLIRRGLKPLVLCSLFIMAFMLVQTGTFASSGALKLTKNIAHNAGARLSVDGGNNLHLTYLQSSDWSSSSSNIYYKKKTPNGSWTSAKKIASEAIGSSYYDYGGFMRHDSYQPITNMAMVSNKGKAYLAYVINDGDREIAFKSNKSGSWPTNPKKVTDNKDFTDYEPSMAQYNGRLYMVYTRRNAKTWDDTEICFTKNVDGKWTEPITLTNNSVNDQQPNIFAKGGKIYVAWASDGYSNRGGWKSEIKYRYLYKGKWSGDHTVISSQSDRYRDPVLAVGSTTYVAYTKTYNWYSTNVGLSYYKSGAWKSTTITSNPSSSVSNQMPKIANFGDKLGITWDRTSEQGSDVWYAYKDSESASWKRQNLTGSSKINESSNSIGMDANGNRHIAFSSDEDGDSDIYYLMK